MNKIKVIGLGLFFSLFFVACTTSSSSSSTPPSTPSGEKQTLSASPESLSFTFGETSFKILKVTSNKAGKGKYSASSNNEAIAKATSNSVGLVRVTPISVGETTIIVKRERDSSYDSASQTIEISVNEQDQNLKVNLGYTDSKRWKLSKDATAAISVAARSVGGVGGDGDLVGSTASYSIEKIESSTTGDVVKASVNPAGEIIITAKNIGDATVTVSNKGDSNYKKEDVAIFITVNDDATQAALNFTNTGTGSITDVTYDTYSVDTNKNITVTGGSAGDFSVKSSDEQVVSAAINNGLITITPVSSGTAVITVTGQGGTDGGTTYNPISRDIRVSINKPAAPTLIADPNIFTRDYNKLDDTADSMASGSISTGDYYIESSKKGQGGSRIIAATASITTLGKITVTFEDAGTTDIIITRAGNYQYRSSSAAIIDVTVDKVAQTLSANFLRVDGDGDGVATNITNEGFETSYTSLARRALFIVKGQGDGPFNKNPIITNNTDNNLNKGVVTKAGIGTKELYNNQGNKEFVDDVLELTLDQAGTTDIIVEKQGDHNYLAGKFTGRVRIDKAGHKISIEGGEIDFQQQLDSDPVTVAILGAKGDGDYTIDSNDDPAVASADFENNDLTLTFGVVGDAEIVFSRNGDRNYKNSNRVTIDVEVTIQANQVLTLGDTELTVTYQDTTSANVSIGTDATGTDNAIVASSNNESVATVTIIDATSIKITFQNAGETTISVYRAGNANFNRSRNRSIKVTVEQASQEIAVATDSKSEFVGDEALDYGDTATTILTGGKASYYIESVIPEGVVTTARIGGSNFDELIIETIGSGTAKISVYDPGNRNYKRSNTLTITVEVNRAAQELTASRSTFDLVYNDTITSAITTTAVVPFDDEGEYVASSSNTNIVTTDIDPKSGLLSLRAVGVGDATITISKQQDSRYLKSDPIEIGVAVIKAGQELTSDITSFSFDKPGDATAFVISGGLSIGEVYTATSDHANIVTTDIDIAGNLSITALATGDATVTVQRAGDANYNAAADLTIRVRVKTQQTLLAEGAVSSFQYKYKESRNVVTITGGQGGGKYQFSSDPAGIVTTDVDANGALSITTVSTGDTTISIYKAGDERYNRSATVDLSVSVARGVVELEYAVINDATTIEYSPTVETEISLETPTGIKPTVFTYTATTSDSDNVITRGHKINVKLNNDNDVVVSTLNADPGNPATIRVTRAQTPYYEEATVDISVTVNKATRTLAYDMPHRTITYQPNEAATEEINLITLTDVENSVENSDFSYTIAISSNGDNDKPTISAMLLGSNNVMVTAKNAHDDPARIRVTRDNDRNYNDETIDIFVTVDKADLGKIEYSDFLPLTYRPPSDPRGADSITISLTLPTESNVGASTTFTYTVILSANSDRDIILPVLATNTNIITVTAQNAGDASIMVTRTEDNYNDAEIEIPVTVNKADRNLVYTNPDRTIVYQLNPANTETIVLEPTINAGTETFSYTHRVIDNGYTYENNPYDKINVLRDLDNDITVTAIGAHDRPARIRVTRIATSNYNTATTDITVRVNRAIQPLTYTYVSQTFTYTDMPSDEIIAQPAIEDVFTGTPLIPLTYTITAIDNDDSHTYIDIDNNNNPVVTPYEVLNSSSLASDGTLTVTAQNAGDATVTVTRAATRNYKAASTDIGVTVEKATLNNIDYKYSGTNISIPDSGEVTVDYFTPTPTYIGPVDSVISKKIKFNIPNLNLVNLHFDLSGNRRNSGIIGITSETLNTVTFTLEWGGRNYVGSSRVFTVTTLRSPTLAYEPTPVELRFEGASVDVEQTTASRTDSEILPNDQDDFSYSVSGFDANIISAEVLVGDDFGTIRITPKGLGTTTLEVTKTFSGSTNNYNPATTDIIVNVSGVQLTHVATTDAVLGDYSGLTIMKDASHLFIAGQPISGRKVIDTGMFDGNIGGAITASADSITSAKLGDDTYIFTANRKKSEVRVYSVANNTGNLTLADMTSDSPGVIIGGASALTTATIMNRLYLFVANSTDDSVSAFEVTNDGKLIYGGNASDGNPVDPGYTFEGASALTTATIDGKHFLFVAGKDENAVASYKINQSVGSSITLSHSKTSAFVSTNYIRGITGALSLAIVSKDASVFLYAAGSTGVKEVEVLSDGAIKRNQATQILNSRGENTFVTVAQKGDTDFLFAAYGNMLKTYVLENNGGTSLLSSSTLPTTNTDDDNSKFNGVSSLTTATIDGKLFLFVAGSTDNGVSVFEVRYLP